MAADWTFEAREVNRDNWWHPAQWAQWYMAQYIGRETRPGDQQSRPAEGALRPVVDISWAALAAPGLPGPSDCLYNWPKPPPATARDWSFREGGMPEERVDCRSALQHPLQPVNCIIPTIENSRCHVPSLGSGQ